MGRIYALLIAVTLAASGCAEGGLESKQNIGLAGGALVGGLLGSTIGSGTGQLLAIGGGALLGGFLGSEIGKRLDEEDQEKAGEAFDKASIAPLGETITWINPENGNNGTVTPLREVEAESGRDCREYRTTVTVDGDEDESTGIACRRADGEWEIVEKK